MMSLKNIIIIFINKYLKCGNNSDNSDDNNNIDKKILNIKNLRYEDKGSYTHFLIIYQL